MKEYYETIRKTGQSLVTEKKSRFIGIAVPVSTEEEALAVIGMKSADTGTPGITAAHFVQALRDLLREPMTTVSPAARRENRFWK